MPVDAGTSDGSVVDASEGGGEACDGSAACGRIVFVTRSVYDADLNGLVGADNKCGLSAFKSPGLAGRSFIAWLSGPGVPALTRFADDSRPFVRTDGTVVAGSVTELASGAIRAPINRDEMNVEVEMQNHPIFDGTLERLARLKTAKPGDPNPFVIGNGRYLAMWNIVSECIQAEIARRDA